MLPLCTSTHIPHNNVHSQSSSSYRSIQILRNRIKAKIGKCKTFLILVLVHDIYSYIYTKSKHMHNSIDLMKKHTENSV